MGEECVVPRPRGWAPAVCAVVLGLLSLVLVSLLDSSLIREASGLIAFSLILGRILHCLCLLIEEWVFHSQQRYGGNVKQMLRACFSTATLAGLCVVFLLLVVGGDTYTPKQWTLVVLTSALYLLLKTLGVLGPAPVEISEVCESRKMNVAHGLAWSFYVGYLKLVLPELEEQVRKHYSKTGEVLSSVRLHILLPLSAAAATRLEEVDRNVLFHNNLPELQLDRAGVRGRVYKHSIYKITDQNKEVYYCVAEYATPLLTLYQMSQDSSAGFSASHRRQQVLLFYTTLSHILETSLECRNRYRLILLDDEQAAEPHYLSRELIKTLQQQEQEIPMDLNRELPRPVREEGTRRAPVWDQHNGFQEEPSSSLPSLMISGPSPLRSAPVENTDYTQNHHNAYR
ncbi:stimulator of interferon genes protein [Colossoma macropomum]|uniref:stimulator of interferon genes protein n=1 Tax=Colossoma macropomum TaxID=42526 RepID=UPI0018649D65|nr:stimulator of interferon genes protein [Colossoma macropomum]